jgi:2-polyprenyl-6-hydroxyphenyl methylase/3-demethylubiquinone-9 3-methyltransferase
MKIRYNKLPGFLKLPFAIAVWAPIDARYFYHYLKNGNTAGYFRLWSEYKKSRGMSRWHDMIDWLGGYPYEYASVQQLTSFYENAGYKLLKLVPDSGYGCNQLVFERVS